MDTGCEWIVEAGGCDPAALADPATLRALFDRMVDELSLRPVGETLWHQFPPPGGGITGLCLLAESHLTCHTYPEHGSICLNLFCCRSRPDWDFQGGLREMLGAEDVTVRKLVRAYGAAEPAVLP